MSTPEAEAKAKADAAAAAATAAAEAKTHVEMKKDGKKLRVHPTCVDAHVSAGWARSTP